MRLVARRAPLPERRARIERAPLRQRSRRLGRRPRRPARSRAPATRAATRSRRSSSACSCSLAAARLIQRERRRADGPRAGRRRGGGARGDRRRSTPAVELRRLRMRAGRRAPVRRRRDRRPARRAPSGRATRRPTRSRRRSSARCPGATSSSTSSRSSDAALRERAHAAALSVPRVREIHNLALVDVDGRIELSLHLKLPGDLPLEDAHEVAEERRARDPRARCRRSTRCRRTSSRWPETAAGERGRRRDARAVERIVREATGRRPRELRFLRTDAGLVAFLTLGLDPQSRLDDAHARASEIEERIRARAPRDRRRDRPHRAVAVQAASRYAPAALKLCMFTPKELALERGWPGRIDGDRVVQLAAQTLQSFFTGGGGAREHAEYALADVDLRPPVLHPPSVRDFMAFEAHVTTTRGEPRPATCRRSGTRSPSSTSRTRPRSSGPATSPVPRGNGGARLRARGAPR